MVSGRTTDNGLAAALTGRMSDRLMGVAVFR
jgi:hypothetical protein